MHICWVVRHGDRSAISAARPRLFLSPHIQTNMRDWENTIIRVKHSIIKYDTDKVIGPPTGGVRGSGSTYAVQDANKTMV